MKPSLLQMAADPNAKLRSKAVAVLGELGEVPSDVVLERVLNDTDARVRANAIEVIENKAKAGYVPLLAERARANTFSSRERANAIKALHRMKVRQATQALHAMLQDPRPEHRISAMWALRQIGWWQLLNEVGRLAKEDQNLRVRRYALAVLRTVAGMLRQNKPSDAA